MQKLWSCFLNVPSASPSIVTHKLFHFTCVSFHFLLPGPVKNYTLALDAFVHAVRSSQATAHCPETDMSMKHTPCCRCTGVISEPRSSPGWQQDKDAKLPLSESELLLLLSCFTNLDVLVRTALHKVTDAFSGRITQAFSAVRRLVIVACMSKWL